jgi:hypothetical protein
MPLSHLSGTCLLQVPSFGPGPRHGICKTGARNHWVRGEQRGWKVFLLGTGTFFGGVAPGQEVPRALKSEMGKWFGSKL